MEAIFLVGLLCVLFNNGIEVDASHSEFQNFQSHNLTVPETQPYRTSYHFRPPKNWLNGMYLSHFSLPIYPLFLFFSLYLFLILNSS